MMEVKGKVSTKSVQRLYQNIFPQDNMIRKKLVGRNIYQLVILEAKV